MRAGPHPFTLRQLQYALAVAEAKNFRAAAERCHVAQPSLSAQIAVLEGALGVRMFERDRTGVRVTDAGAQVIERARRLLVDADDLADAARGLGDPLAGLLRVGVIPTLSPYLLPIVVPALSRALPKISFQWTEDKTDVLVPAVDGGVLDGALLALEARVGALSHEVIGEDPFVLATPIGHPLAKAKKPARLAELGGAGVLLLDDGHCLRDQALEVCSRAQANELDFRATSLPTLVQMVASGAGVTLLPELAVPAETRRARIAVRRLAAPAPRRTIALVWRKSTAREPALRATAAAARAAYERSREKAA